MLSRHAAGWDLTLPQENKALPLAWAHNTERNTPGWSVSRFLSPALCVSRFLLCLSSHASHQPFLKSGVGRMEGLSHPLGWLLSVHHTGSTEERDPFPAQPPCSLLLPSRGVLQPLGEAFQREPKAQHTPLMLQNTRAACREYKHSTKPSLGRDLREENR